MSSTKYILILLLSGMLFNSCRIFKGQQPKYQPSQLLSITALDLSEDKSILSTQNDEILVSILFGSDLAGEWYTNGFYLPVHTFDSNTMTYTIDSVLLSTEDDCTGCEVWICLIELDEDSTEENTHQKLLALVNSVGYRALDSKAVVDDHLKDNDFLGYARIPYHTPLLDTLYDIRGKDLLDPYHYQIRISKELVSERIGNN